ncbi:2-oxo acid dehydrogenase subunit E2 [Candidatus Poribacteria bacterium]|nr:2-oxo acid dehydrogenase subunit E2 [Candidatus Poribacteria bacterium]
MATLVQLLQLSPTMSEGTIVRWLVKEGDKVKAGAILAEVETDKAVMEQESFEDGVVLKLLAKEGDAVAVGAQIAVIGEAGEDIASLPIGGLANKPSKKAEAAPKSTAPVKDEPIVKSDAPPKVNFRREPEPTPVAKAKPAAPAKSNGGRVVASPLARKMAEVHGLDLSRVSGSGPGQRIIKRDIEEALAGGVASPAVASRAVIVTGGPDEEVPLTGMRKTIARRLVQSRQEIPSFNLTIEVDAEPLLRGVARMKEVAPDAKVTLTHFLIKAMACVLMRHPWVRTQWVEGRLVRKNTANIPVAVAIEDGLLTPVIRGVEGKGVVQIAAELRDLAARARARKLTEADLTGGVQTLSNLGMFGIDNFDAIINPPESSILACGAVVEKPVVRAGSIVPGKTLTITMGCDHRVVDGAVGASYLKDLKASLEEPLLMLQ